MFCFRNKQKKVNTQIEKRIQKDKDDFGKEIKVLLLGHIKFILLMLENARKVKQKNYTSNQTVNLDDMDTIKSLWADPGMRKCYKECKECQLTDSQRYFIDHIDRITESNYIPNLYDILHCTINSCGITEHSYNIDGHLLRFIDIRGARTERRKWIHYFDNMSVLMFIVALSDYNKIESYSDGENRLDIAKSLFKAIIDYPWFQNCGIMLFMSKKDIIEEQIMHTNLVDYFPEFRGPKKNAHEATEFIIKMFVELNTDHDRIIYPYSVCLLDAENVRSVLASAIKDMVMNQNLMKNTISTCCCF
ncbi:Hypothetical predicted protein [Mytilus galloprovincialis]|uniref:Guanine nucleotide-binding protein subunit alpha n=1 Tax=Mytilus galloprovincialis TaxID=29158 RepID=A0A8B6FH96_MYTGA|nr:Hypothetical predicted protein [Mytilus galloprovincialis]